MAISAEGVNAIKTFVVDCVLDAGGKTCPPTIVGVGGSADLCVHLAKIAATRPLGSHCADAEGRRLEAALSVAVIQLDVGPQSRRYRDVSTMMGIAALHPSYENTPRLRLLRDHRGGAGPRRFTRRAFS